MGDAHHRPSVADPALTYIFDSLDRIETKLDNKAQAADALHNRLILWCALLSVALGGGWGLMHL